MIDREDWKRSLPLVNEMIKRGKTVRIGVFGEESASSQRNFMCGFEIDPDGNLLTWSYGKTIFEAVDKTYKKVCNRDVDQLQFNF